MRLFEGDSLTFFSARTSSVSSGSGANLLSCLIDSCCTLAESVQIGTATFSTAGDGLFFSDLGERASTLGPYRRRCSFRVKLTCRRSGCRHYGCRAWRTSGSFLVKTHAWPFSLGSCRSIPEEGEGRD
ncbi:hypothetical protein HPP92_005836 [Vanilla planifolia]|uniref:Uncharacterized protein n=1 Tax=Vanilla planifolia TaxID=51239 RepID=A0A835VDK3_VANPL|nr:hypothetical protein HPP92_005836 [Vanilla planifolia]